jgi:hypothetical protein
MNYDSSSEIVDGPEEPDLLDYDPRWYERIFFSLASRLYSLYVGYYRQAASYIRAEVRLFDSLRSIDAETKRELRPLVRAHAKQVAKADVWYRYIFKADSKGAVGLGTFAPPYMLSRSDDTPPAIIGLILLASLMLSVIWHITILGYVLVVSALGFIFIRRQLRHPETVVVEDLLVVLVLLERSRPWATMKLRRTMMARMEDAANALERLLPRRLRSKDGRTNRWTRRELKSRAAAIRAAKRLIISPQPESPNELASRLASDLCQALKGHWLLIKAAEPKEVRAQGIWRSFDLRPLLFPAVIVILLWALQQIGGLKLTTIVMAFLPWTLIWLAEKTLDFKLPDAVKAILTIAWVMVVLLPAVDPHWTDNLDNLNKLRDFFSN